MKNENSNIDVKNKKFSQNQTPEIIIKEKSIEKDLEKKSTMISIKNMFNLNSDKNSNENNHSNNSFYKESNQEKKNNNFIPIIPRAFSNNQISKEKHLNNKNFPSKANFCKGNLELNKNHILPNSSPIFQYYASIQTDNNFYTGGQGQDLGTSLENNSLGYLGGRDSPYSTGFNYSPSQIFNNNGSIKSKSEYAKAHSDKNTGTPFSIDSETDEDKIKNLDFNLPSDDLYTIEFDYKNFDVNFAEDKNIIVNKINEIKNKNNDNINLNSNKNNNDIGNNNNLNKNINKDNDINKNFNSNNKELYIEIKNNEKQENDKEITSNLPIRKVMEKLRKKKTLESNEQSNIISKNNDIIENNNKITNKSNIDKNNENNLINENHMISSDCRNRIRDDLDKMDNNYLLGNNNKANIEDNISDKIEKENFKEKNNINEIKIKNMNNSSVNGNNTKKGNEKNEIKKNILNGDEEKYINSINNNIINVSENKFYNYQKGNEDNKPFLNNKKNNFINNNNFNTNIFDNNNFILNNNNYNNNFYNQNHINNSFNNSYINYTNPQQLYNLANSNNTWGHNYYNSQNAQNISMINQPFNINNNKIFNNYNYQIPQQFNLNNFQKNNQLLQGTGNINIQNNYFMYNNNQEIFKNNENEQNQNKIQMNNNIQNQINENNNIEKPKKKRKKKQKRLDSSSYMNKPLSYFADNFVSMAKDQGASRYLQQLLDNNPKDLVDILFVPLCKNILKLINDPFGNYLIQKIITYFNQEQLLKILNIISPSFYEISCNSHGTRVLQKMIGLLTSPIIKNYFFELVKPIITPLLKDLNGTYIVQKFATQNLDDYGLKINSIIIENSSELCTHRHGCCVIQKYLETRDKSMLPQLIDKLIEDSLLLIIDQFGNYVIQTILLIGDKKYGNKLAEKISSNIVFYAKHKYSSNVVEKCFDYCDGIYLKTIMNNVQKKENLIKLILDEHGNYVVQKVLSLSSSKKQKIMLSIIKTLFDKLKNLPYGQRVINRIVTTYPFINNL